MVSQNGLQEFWKICLQRMVSNMVSQPATTKQMVVIARRYANLLDQATLFFYKNL
jgi:uncharacterized protein YejL (UPF0352 family)